MKAFVLVRGVETGRLYLYGQAAWEHMMKGNEGSNKIMLEFVMDSDDREVLEGYQKLVNKDIEVDRKSVV